MLASHLLLAIGMTSQVSALVGPGFQLTNSYLGNGVDTLRYTQQTYQWCGLKRDTTLNFNQALPLMDNNLEAQYEQVGVAGEILTEVGQIILEESGGNPLVLGAGTFVLLGGVACNLVNIFASKTQTTYGIGCSGSCDGDSAANVYVKLANCPDGEVTFHLKLGVQSVGCIASYPNSHFKVSGGSCLRVDVFSGADRHAFSLQTGQERPWTWPLANAAFWFIRFNTGAILVNGGKLTSLEAATNKDDIKIMSQDGSRSFGFDKGGALKVWHRTASATVFAGGNNIGSLRMQSDCNLVLYTQSNVPVWSSNTWNRGTNCYLKMQNDGNLVIYTGGTPLWATATNSLLELDGPDVASLELIDVDVASLPVVQLEQVKQDETQMLLQAEKSTLGAEQVQQLEPTA